MDFDTAKENIQPLATGRNISLLQASLSLDSAQSQELVAQRNKLKNDVENYVGDDPLGPWHTYICWIEQSYPAGGNESRLQMVLKDCLTQFEKDDRYKQDRRFIKLFIKFAQEQKNPLELYQEMYRRGTGTMVADFYIAWAYCCDLSGNMHKADEIFRLGLQCRAKPLDELREAHQHFGYTVGQRMLYSDGEQADAVNQELNERRLALQSLQGRRQRGSNTITVGSVRTGAAVKSEFPGVVQMDGPSTSRKHNADRNVEVFRDENADSNILQPVVDQEVNPIHHSIVDAARGVENLKESMPWNKAHAKTHKQGKIFGRNSSSDLGFDIHVDEYALPVITKYERRLEKPFQFPPNFVAKNKPLGEWVTPVTIEDEPEANGLPCYNKAMLYPRPNLEFSPEEYRAYTHLKRQDPQHPLVLRNDLWWGTGSELRGIRCYPNFATTSKPQKPDELDKYFKPPAVANIQVVFDQIYNDDEQTEYQGEELLAVKWRQKRNLTVIGDFDMEETVCLPGAEMPRRKSFFPAFSRKSMMPRRALAVEEEDKAEAAGPAALEDVIPAKPSADLSQPPVLSQQPDVLPKIKIFEDSVSTPDDNFAVPDPPPRNIEIYEDPDELEPAPIMKPTSVFDGDETCSTQVFNMFIKSHGISTPKGTQKQAPARQFGTVLKELSPAEEPALSPTSTESPVESRSPMLRKQLSTILETSEHGTQSSANTNATTKSTITSSSSSPGSRTALTLTTKSEESTPGPLRLQRLAGPDSSTVRVEQEKQPGGNFSCRELWEPNAPSVPLMKSLRFQEDKTETIPRALPCFQEDKTETLPRLPVGFPECTLAAGELTPLKLPTLDDENDLCGLFGKTPTKMKAFGSPILQDASKRVCDQTTPDLYTKPMRRIQDSIAASFAEASSKPSAAPEVSQLADSFMNDMSFVPETQPASAPNPGAPALQKKFEIFLDETQPEIISDLKTTPQIGCSFTLDCTVPETQLSVVHKEPVKKQEVVGPSHMIASFMNDCTELSSCPPHIPGSVDGPSSAGTLKFVSDSTSRSPRKSTNASGSRESGKQSDNFFELNAATEMFATNISMIKNSTLLPPPLAAIQPAEKTEPEEEDDLSIYYKTTPVTPKQSHHSWSQSDNETPPRDQFVHFKANMDKSALSQTLADTNVNPFNVDLINSLLDEIDFSMYIEKLPHCQLVGQVKRLRPNVQIEVNDEEFEVVKMIGKGSYGTIYSGRHIKTGKKVALKQERPANYWEFYITLEVHSRLTSEEMIPAYTHFDYALVGNNSSVYISDFSDYGSLISVCNKMKSDTCKNLDEYVVIHLSCQMLDIVDHLHALGIIHADIKADNFLLMRPLCAHPNDVSLQLIDFGVSIDTRRFPPNQTFNYVHHHDLFKCIEMRTNRPWTYQLDLFGLVGVMHVLLFGSYMEVVQRNPSGVWMPKTALPRYFQRQMWETVFRTLLNIRDCRTMPNLQELRTLLKSELAEKEKYVGEAINKFNMILHK